MKQELIKDLDLRKEEILMSFIIRISKHISMQDLRTEIILTIKKHE